MNIEKEIADRVMFVKKSAIFEKKLSEAIKNCKSNSELEAISANIKLSTSQREDIERELIGLRHIQKNMVKKTK